MKNLKTVLLALTLLGVSACNSSSTDTTQVKEVVSETVTAKFAGVFEGRSDHITTGTASIVGTTGHYMLALSDNFELDGAPDPIVGFGKNGNFDIATKLGALKNRTGQQNYDLPSNFTPSSNLEVYIWCEKFNVPLGVATLN